LEAGATPIFLTGQSGPGAAGQQRGILHTRKKDPALEGGVSKNRLFTSATRLLKSASQVFSKRTDRAIAEKHQH